MQVGNSVAVLRARCATRESVLYTGTVLVGYQADRWLGSGFATTATRQQSVSTCPAAIGGAPLHSDASCVAVATASRTPPGGVGVKLFANDRV